MLAAITLLTASMPPAPRQTSATGPVTFTRDIAPVVFKQCAQCHQPEGPAPFSLLTYDDVRWRATRAF
jgi:mono/diheme cytochrome c family protein